MFGFLVHLSSCFISGQAYYVKNIFPKQVLRKQAARGRSSVGEYWWNDWKDKTTLKVRR